MELLDLAGLAGHANVPVSLARYYRDRFILFVPAVRVGASIFHPVEAVEIIKTINHLVSSGSTAADIEEFLQRIYPVSVITSRDVERSGGELGALNALGELASMLDNRGAHVAAEVSSLRAEIAALAAGVGERSAEANPPGDPAGSEMILAGLEQIHSRIGTLASREQLEWIGDVVSAATHAPNSGRIDPRSEELLQRVLDEVTRPDPIQSQISFELQRLNDTLDRLADSSHNLDALSLRHDEEGARWMEREQAIQSALERQISELRAANASSDAELLRGFRGLIVAMRSELADLRGVVAELCQQSHQSSVGRSSWSPVVVNGTGHLAETESTADRVRDYRIDGRGARAPRRMGQQARAAESESDGAMSSASETGS